MRFRTRRRRCRRRRIKGFTLVEMAVCLVIAVILMAALTAILQHKRNYVRWQDSSLLWSGQARAAFDTMSRDVRSADAIDVEEGLLQLDPPSEAGASITYRLEPEREGSTRGRLLVREQDGQRSVLATEVAELRLVQGENRLDIVLEFSALYGSFRSRASHQTTVAVMRDGGGA